MSDESSSAWLKPILKPLKPMYREVGMISLFVNLLALAVPVFTMQIYDRVIFHAGVSTLEGLLVGMALVLLFDFVLRQVRSRMMQRAALRIDVAVGRSLFDKVLAMPLAVLEARTAAYWNALFKDVDVVRNTLSGPSAILITALPFAFLFLGLIFVIAWPVAYVIALILPVFVVIGWRSAQVVNQASAEERESGFGRDTLMAEIISGRSTVKALALEEDLKPLWEEKQAETIERSILRGGRADKYINMGAGLATFTSITMVSVGALAIMEQQLTIGSLIAANMLSNRVLGPFNQLVGSWRGYASYRQAVKRLGEAFDMPVERSEISIKHDRPHGVITLENVKFSYAADSGQVIDGVRLEIQPGGLIAILGANGSGKSTLVKMIQGLYQPTDGRILLDGADIKQFTRSEMSEWFGYVPQECFLFTGTIRDNIAKGNSEATDEEILVASKKAGLHEYIIDFPDGYGTEVGEGGQRLSGGMRQRLTIARGLLGDPPILVLDEPSSNLDRSGEAELAETLENLAQDHTVLLITHSPGLLVVCRQVLIMQKGRIVRSGRPIDVVPQLVAGQVQPPTLREQA